MPPANSSRNQASLLLQRESKRKSKAAEDAKRFGLDGDELLKQSKTHSGYIDQRDKREFLEQELSIQDSHLSPEEKQKKKSNKDMMDAVRQCRAKYAMEWCYAGDLPLAYYTEYLLPYLLDDKQNKDLRDALEFGHPPLLNKDWTLVGGGVANSLEMLGCKKLESFYTDNQLLWEWIDLLMIGRRYPSRADILSKEAPNLKTSTERRGSLRDEIVMGRMTDFILAIDVFLEYSAIQRSARLTRKLPALEKIMQEVWKQVDLDGDGTLSVDEAEEVARLILSRPMFGKVLIAMVCNDPNSAKAAAVRDAIPSKVIQAATGVCSIAKEFWSLMDIDGDGEVTGQEFCEKFAQAFETAFALPIAHKLALVAFDKPVPEEMTVDEHGAVINVIQNGITDVKEASNDAITNVKEASNRIKSNRTCTLDSDQVWSICASGRRKTPKDPMKADQVPADPVKMGFPEAPVADTEVEVTEEWDTSLANAQLCQADNFQEASQAGCKKGCSIM